LVVVTLRPGPLLQTPGPPQDTTPDLLTEVQNEEDVPQETQQDTDHPCIPDCFGKECGEDGCGASCGTCPGEQDCKNGKCKCQPDCTDRECGDDGCGDSCGDCNDYNECTKNACESGLCVFPVLLDKKGCCIDSPDCEKWGSHLCLEYRCHFFPPIDRFEFFDSTAHHYIHKNSFEK
jgi:hypothetical protein